MGKLAERSNEKCLSQFKIKTSFTLRFHARRARKCGQWLFSSAVRLEGIFVFKRECLCLALILWSGLLGAEEEKTKEQKEAEDFCRRAKAALRDNNERRAYVLTEEALKADPKCFHAHTIRGVVALKRGDRRKALEEFRHEEEANLGFIEKPPREDAAYWKNHLAWFYAEHQIPGKIEDAFRLSKDALAANPDEPDYLDTLAELYYWRGGFDEALSVIERALAQKKDHGKPIGRTKLKYLEGQRDKFLSAQKADKDKKKRLQESAEIESGNKISSEEKIDEERKVE
jgi:tetratricopeptide (TPR) repeat protein